MTTARSGAAVPILQRVYRQRKPHRLRRLVFGAVLLAVLIVAALLGIGWYFSSQLLDVTQTSDSYNLRVLSAGNGAVTLTRDASDTRPGTYELVWHGGSAQLGAVLSSSGSDVRRRIVSISGNLTAGTQARVDHWMYASPAALGLRYQTVDIPDPLGPMPAWYVPGRGNDWVILVHGYKASRREGLRPMPVLAGLGLPILDITYRNDLGAPQSPDHLYHLGATEWQDLQAAVRYALARGAHGVILYGYSMGGGIVEYFLHHSPYAGRVRAVVLDSPAVDWSSILDLQAGQRSLPGFVTAVGKRIVLYRLGLSSFDQLNALVAERSLKTPTLLFEGAADSSVPIGPGLAFAHARPDLVKLVVVRGAEHTEAWNANPAVYDAQLKSFFRRVTSSPR